MSAVTRSPGAQAPQSPRTVQIMTGALILLAAVAAAGGIFLPGLYRDSAWAVTAMRAGDWFTLLFALPALTVTIITYRPGATRSTLVLAGLVGYVLYTYIGGAFAFAFNEFFLLYVVLMSLSAFTIATLVNSLNVAALPTRFDAALPRKAVAGFLIGVALMLVLAEVGQIIPFLTVGKLPLVLELSGAPTFFVYSMDLGVIAPLSILAGVWLLKRNPWGLVLAGIMLVKAAAMGLMLVLAAGYARLIGATADPIELVIGYSVIAFGGLGMAIWFFRHCRG